MNYKYALPLLLLFITSACSDDDTEDINLTGFTTEPQIEYQSIEFKDFGNGEPDSIIVSVSYKDLEGDLGLEHEEIQPPYNWKNYFSNKTGDYLDFENETIDDLLKYSDRTGIDTLPPFDGIYKCFNWEINPGLYFWNDLNVYDTVQPVQKKIL